MKFFILIIISIFINSCYYSNGCVYTPQMVNCYVDKGNPYPIIAGYQKNDQIGHTDVKERWNDIVNCGGVYGDITVTKLSNKLKEHPKPYEILDSCMRKKGYVIFHPGQCGYQNPKWDKGKCNL